MFCLLIQELVNGFGDAFDSRERYILDAIHY